MNSNILPSYFLSLNETYVQKKLPIKFNHLILTYKHINLNQVYQLVSMVDFNYYCELIFASH